MSDLRVRPFTTGSQWSDWQERNCEHCSRGSYDCEHDDPLACEIFNALSLADWDDGTISREMAQRMGYPLYDSMAYNWPCPECLEIHGDCERIQATLDYEDRQSALSLQP